MRYVPSCGNHPREYLLSELLGRYECVTGSSNKFYHVLQAANGAYVAFFGRIGSANPQSLVFSSPTKAASVLAQRHGKGYHWVSGYATKEIQWVEERQKHLEAVLQQAPEPEPSSTVLRKPRL